MLWLSGQMCGQATAQYEELALKSFYSKDFPTTLFYCEKIIEKNDDHVASLFYAGESARLMGDLPSAESYLEKIPEESKVGYFSITDYELGLVKYGLDKRDEAKIYFEKYLDKHYNKNNRFSHLAKNAVKSLASGNSPIGAGSYLAKLPANVNTANADLAPLRYADKLYYSTVLEENYLPTKNKKKSKRMVQHPVNRVYEAKFGTEARESAINPRSVILNASNVALMPDASRMYYTLCTDETPGSQEECTIWYRNRKYDGSWGGGIKLPKHINKRNCTNTQPTVGFDWGLKKYVLYFVSDRPGGVGGKDIWCSEIENDGSFGKPFLLPFNTIADDVTPFFHQQSQTLFFSSKGMQGNGGFDIFHTEKTSDRSWKVPENLGKYLNTDGDELYYTYHTSSNFAYFVTSDALQNGKGGDIIEARVFVDYQLRFFDNPHKKPLTSIAVEIEDLETGAVGLVESGSFSYRAKLKLEPGTKYRITVKAAGFQQYSFDVSTDNVSYIQKREKNIFLNPLAKP